MKVMLLDCTLRDGGYYNQWDFDRRIVDRYLASMKASLVDIVELGFRSLPKSTFVGPYAYTTDEFIEQLDLPKGPLYGVMIDGKEFGMDRASQTSNVKRIFGGKDKSLISLVRIAINFNHVYKVESITRQLKDMGYQIAINMMQSHGKSHREYLDTAFLVSSWDTVNVLYFADSLGSMIPEDISKICRALKTGWEGSLGIHSHNNKNLSLINSITAVENGVTWCDGTIAGMGRGAGNAAMESLILEMSMLGHHKGNANMLRPTVDDFALLRKEYDWGPNLYYHYASNHSIHPTFVMSLLEDVRYDNHQVMEALEFLADRDSTTYSIDAVRKAIYGNQKDARGAWCATGWLENQEALIIGAGQSVEKYRDGILQYIERATPAVLMLNINRYLPKSIAAATVVSHEKRALFDAQQYHELCHPIIMPKNRLDKIIKDKMKNLEILDYDLALREGTFRIGSNGCTLQWPLAAAYAFAIVTQAGARSISLVGFDGYTADDPRQEQMNDVFTKYMSLKESLRITALTPTTYRIDQGSVFAP